MPHQGWNGAIRHGGRTLRSIFNLGPEHVTGGTSSVSTRLGPSPRASVETGGNQLSHQLVPGRMELDLVPPPAEAIEEPGYGGIAVSRIAQGERRPGTQVGAEGCQPVASLSTGQPRFADNGVPKRGM